MPLWVAVGTDVPRWVVAPLMLVNTVAIVALQVRAARGVTTPAAGALALRRAGASFLMAWTLLGLAGGAGVAVALALLAAGVAVHTLGELWQASAAFELSFALARPDAQGQYLGVFGLGQGVADAVAPVLIASACVGMGVTGWAGLGLAVAATAALAPVTVARALRGGSRSWAQAG